MFRLRILGRVDLRDDDGQEVDRVLAQPKRLALLAYLAVHPATSRGALLTLLWPDLVEGKARNALRQALHQVRQALAPGVFVSTGANTIRVDAAHLWCDAAEFDRLLAQGRLAEAIALHEGDLLPGFTVPGAPAFGEWLDAQRGSLRRRCGRAAWALAEAEARAGRCDAAAACATRALELLADDEPAFRQVLALLGRIGDVSGALRAYARFAEAMRRELDAEPAAETREVAEAMRTQAVQAAPAPPGPKRVVREAAAPSARPALAVCTFQNLTGDASLDYVGRLVAEAVVQGMSDTRMVDVAASGERTTRPAELIVEGSYHHAGELLGVRARIQRSGSDHGIVHVPEVRSAVGSPWDAAHEMSRRISGALAGHLDPRVESWADAVAEPPSFDAYRSHRRGIELHLRGEFRPAITHFLRAASLDAGFAVPMLWAIQASLNLEEYERAAALLEAVTAYRAELSVAEQLGCDYFAVLLAGDRGSAYRTLVRVAELVPDSEVLAQLGRDAMFINRPHFAVETLERLGPTRGWMPEWTPYWRRLTEACHMTGDHARELQAAERGRAQHPEAISTLVYLARAHAALLDVAAVERTADIAVTLAADRFATAADVLFTAARELRAHGAAADAARMLDRAIEWEQGQETEDREPRRLLLARMFYEAGRLDECERTFAADGAASADDIELTGLRGAVAARRGDAEGARAAVGQLLSMRGRYRFGRHLLGCARIEAVLDNATPAIEHLRAAMARGGRYDVELHVDVDLALVAHDERFREMIRPKG